MLIPTWFSPSTRLTAPAACTGHFPSEARAPEFPWSVVGHHAAASTDGHVMQAAERLVSARALRAETACALRSAGTASPVPKYISSGVCPRNAEWAST